MIRTTILTLAALVMLSSTSQASFVFDFSQSAVNVQIGGSVTVDLIATNTGAATDSLESFQFTIQQQAPTTTNITPMTDVVAQAAPVPAIVFAAGQDQVIGSYVFTASPSATVGESVVYASLAGNNYSSTLLGPVFASISSDLTVTAVPEPTSLIMFGSVVGIGLLRRRR